MKAKTPQKIYKIQRDSDGLFASTYGFTSRGRMFNGLAPLKCHLFRQERNGASRYRGCTIVSCEISYKPEVSIADIAEQMTKDQVVKETKRRADAAAYEKRRKEEQLAKLKQELGHD